jgi:hypothetical protein
MEDNEYSRQFKIFGPYFQGEKGKSRQFVILIDKDGVRRTCSYPKFIMECHLGRKLDPDLETIEHKNTDYFDNSEDNLMIVDRVSHSKMDTRRVKLIDLTCPVCGNSFKRSPRILRDKARKKSPGPFCSKSCSGRYTQLVKNKKIKKVKTQKGVKSEYYKQKYVSACAASFIEKYAFSIGEADQDIEELDMIHTAAYIQLKYKI